MGENTSRTYHFNNDVTGFPESGTSTIGDLFDLWGRQMTVTIEPNNSPITTTTNIPLTMKTYYYDFDGDGYHSDTRQATTNPGSRWKVTTKGPDCNDNNLYNNIDCRQSWYTDVDGDGYHGKTERSDTEPEGGGWIKGRSYGQDCNDYFYSIENSCGNGGCNTSAGDLKAMFPNLTDTKATQLATILNQYSKQFGIDTKEKLQHFLAQAGLESKNFTKNQEDTKYQVRVAKSIFGILFTANNKDISDFGSFQENGKTYISNQEAFFNFIYDDAVRAKAPGWSLNGNTNPGDGFKYIGRGSIQLTGKEKYTKFTTWYQTNINQNLNFVNNPGLLNTNFEVGVLASLWFFKEFVIDKINIDDKTTSIKVTLKVNPKGLNAPERKANFDKAKLTIKCN